MSDNLQPWTDPELEARVVALVLGEASDFEREEIERLIREKPELGVFQRRIAAVHGLLGQGYTSKPEERWRMVPERRARVLGALGLKSKPGKATAILRQGGGSGRRFPATRVILAAAACLLGLACLAGLLFPSLSMMRSDVSVIGAKADDVWFENAGSGQERSTETSAKYVAEGDRSFGGRSGAGAALATTAPSSSFRSAEAAPDSGVQSLNGPVLTPEGPPQPADAPEEIASINRRSSGVTQYGGVRRQLQEVQRAMESAKVPEEMPAVETTGGEMVREKLYSFDGYSRDDGRIEEARGRERYKGERLGVSGTFTARKPGTAPTEDALSELAQPTEAMEEAPGENR